METGTHNESNIEEHVEAFFVNHSPFTIEGKRAYGLLCFGRFSAVLEYKTRVTERTKQSELLLAQGCGIFATVELQASGFGSLFKQMIPDPSHRSQILHNIVCGGVEDGFLIYASQTEIIRVVHVRVGVDVTTTYRAALTVIRDAHLKWVYEENNLQLWRALVRIIDDLCRPLPPAKHILPSLVGFWNRIKGGIDVYSRHLTNV
ncbi:hypothetical protein PHYSODRAFT_319025 [Phytophthora sojae]|uniref:Uncharacterized protein n=1 Tax=Phytophthora sojae (strain P6497) TaxID=1094619 RepID=G5A7U6_PHYSP|nr:hypothetical protein PHYSODRAFT_319025 [Phytophthora sojae]EGZ07972.1 hypothetical protein PHYSODRAFT_319025 [Phytophthora sojae]|eukprot:XP_009536144.1 hypothetical protein PHYSODRAFT_319025 [Phytophthora sojae]